MHKEVKCLSANISITQSMKEHELNKHFPNEVYKKCSISLALREMQIQNYTEVPSHPHQNVCYQDTVSNSFQL